MERAAEAAAPAKTIEERLRLLEDQQEIVRTFNQYARARDFGAPLDVWLDCFVEDAVWRSSVDAQYAGTTGLVITGHKELADWFIRDGRHDPGFRPAHPSKHIYSDLDVRLDGGTARCTSYLVIPAGAESGPAIVSLGWFEDTLVRCPDGRWRFRERHLHREGASPAGQVVSVGGHEAPGTRPTIGKVV